ncbi:hypothetical protein NQ314_001005 [Rhamnusium bicolor]|uniref:Uncharacterized protein n=1 Tax=Rhamnusium bicolor TaxID=1586634 RepID=A0AAV8ZUE4_9CUCU|nr:hypothetical protein NQ314_001005 [Rhamnusium bicolor]
MELEENLNYADTFLQANAKNKLDVIGRQMKNLQELMKDVISETKLHTELNNVACNFVKKPGHIYHLYERTSGQKYFSMLSPEVKRLVAVVKCIISSFRLEADQSWTPAGQEDTRYQGINYLRDTFSNHSGMRALCSDS